jgi:signal transduction histidine kinase
MIAPPVLALLIVNRVSALAWTVVSVACLTAFIALAMQGKSFPIDYNEDWSLIFQLMCTSGITLIVVTISLIFESNTIQALNEAELQKKALQKSQAELAQQHDEILEKNAILLAQKEELTTQSEQLKELNEKKDYLMEILAHDLKSPLANIQALIGFIKTDKLPSDSLERQVVDMIVDSSRKSQALIQKILNSENLENILYNLNLERLNIGELVGEVVADVAESAERKHIGLRVSLNGARNVNVLVDRIYVKQVFENLLTNAIKFSLPGKHITVTAESDDTKVRLHFRDEGPGIAPDEMGLLFRKYKKLSNRPTAGESSTGLGLSIVKHYTELLKGRVWCESTPGQGSDFIVELPVARN